MAKTLDIGKIPSEILKQIVYKRGGSKRSEVLLYPSIGEDTSVVDIGSELLVLSTDPITGATERSGWLACKVALNDLGAAGAEPLCIMVTLLLPESSTENDLTQIMDDIHSACLQENVAVAGGHTEVTPGLTAPIISITAVGKTRGRRVLSASGAKAGDDIVVTKWAGMEGTAILAKDFEKVLSGKIKEEFLAEAVGLLDHVSVTQDGYIALQNNATGCHDATEGGVLGAIYEICEASNKGVLVDAQSIPVLECTREIASLTGIDPLRLVSSGCLVVTVENGEKLCDVYRHFGINACVVGKITPHDRHIKKNGEICPLMPPRSDELWRARRHLENMSK